MIIDKEYKISELFFFTYAPHFCTAVSPDDSGFRVSASTITKNRAADLPRTQLSGESLILPAGLVRSSLPSAGSALELPSTQGFYVARTSVAFRPRRSSLVTISTPPASRRSASFAKPGVIATVAEFERDLLIERTQAGLARAKSEGKTLGRPQALQGRAMDDVRERLEKGEPVATIARAHNTSRQTIMRIRDAMAPA